MTRTQDQSSNIARVFGLLAAIGPDNSPRRVREVLDTCAIARATGFGLIRAMVKAGLLERVDHGLIRLGPAAARFAFAPLSARYSMVLKERRASTSFGPSGRVASAPAAVRLWNPTLVEMVEPMPPRRSAPWRIGFANASRSNPWRGALERSLRYAVRLHKRDISHFEVYDADDDPQRQVEQIEAMTAAGIDLLVVSAAPDESGRITEVLRGLMLSGTPVIAVDRRPSDPEAVLSFVTASDALIGRTSAIWLAEHLGGDGRIWMLSGLAGASPAVRRQSAALQAFSEFPGIRIEAVAHTGWRREGGTEAVTRFLAEFDGPPDGVWCDSGLQGVGSIEAFLAEDLPIPPHTGGDLNQMYKLAIHNRTPFVAVDYPAAMGARAIDVALEILQGAPVPKRVETPAAVVMPRGCETASVKADEWAEVHVRWDLPDDAVLSQGPSLKLYDDAVERLT